MWVVQKQNNFKLSLFNKESKEAKVKADCAN